MIEYEVLRQKDFKERLMKLIFFILAFLVFGLQMAPAIATPQIPYCLSQTGSPKAPIEV
jgi:hypothetical protein